MFPSLPQRISSPGYKLHSIIGPKEPNYRYSSLKKRDLSYMIPLPPTLMLLQPWLPAWCLMRKILMKDGLERRESGRHTRLLLQVKHSVPVNTILPHRNASPSLSLPNLFKSPHPIPIVCCQSHAAGHREADPGRLRMRLTSYAVIQPFDLPLSRLSGQSLTREFHINVIMRAQPIVTERYRPGGVVRVYGRDKALVAVRTFRHKAMDAMYMVDLMQCVDKLATSCGIKEPGYQHQRGNFAQIRIGWNHGMGEGENVSLPPTLSFFHLRSNASPRCRIA